MLTESQESTQTTNPQYQQLLQVAQRLSQQNPDWVTFFREILGIEGIVRTTFPTFDALTEFERSDEFAEIQKMVVTLRENKAVADNETEPTRVITVRLPKSMHEYLRTEAHDLRTSMNKLCISKLLQVIEQDLIPTEKTSPPKRRTTPVPATAPAQTSSFASTAAPAPAAAPSNSISPFKTNY